MFDAKVALMFVSVGSGNAELLVGVLLVLPLVVMAVFEFGE
jgi:hypothetical protein